MKLQFTEQAVTRNLAGLLVGAISHKTTLICYIWNRDLGLHCLELHPPEAPNHLHPNKLHLRAVCPALWAFGLWTLAGPWVPYSRWAAECFAAGRWHRGPDGTILDATWEKHAPTTEPCHTWVRLQGALEETAVARGAWPCVPATPGFCGCAEGWENHYPMVHLKPSAHSGRSETGHTHTASWSLPPPRPSLT